MTDRERLLEILNVPIYPHENVDPLEAVADYLLDNGVRLEAEQATSDKASKVVEIDQFNKWIPVTERLPENDTAVIVATDNGIVFQCLYAYDGWDLWDGHSVNVTHWMPLPEPPASENV